MAILDIYSNNVKYLYRVRVCSISALVVLIAIVFTLITPLVFVYHAGGKYGFFIIQVYREIIVLPT